MLLFPYSRHLLTGHGGSDSIGYRHEPFQHCPQGATDRCACDPHDNNNFYAEWAEAVKGADPERWNANAVVIVLYAHVRLWIQPDAELYAEIGRRFADAVFGEDGLFPRPGLG